MTGVMTTLGALAGKVNIDRSDVFNDKIGKIIVDTVCAYDTHTWETGICQDKWIIVEQYETRKLAEKGHKKWVAKIKKNPKTKLKDINLWNL